MTPKKPHDNTEARYRPWQGYQTISKALSVAKGSIFTLALLNGRSLEAQTKRALVVERTTFPMISLTELVFLCVCVCVPLCPWNVRNFYGVQTVMMPYRTQNVLLCGDEQVCFTCTPEVGNTSTLAEHHV